MVEELETVFDSGATVGNFGEVVPAQDLLILEAEGAVIGGNNLQVVVFQAVPEFGEIFLFAKRRSENVFGTLESGAFEFVNREQKILWASFGESGDTPVACL